MGGFGNNMFAALSDPKKGSKKGSNKSKSKKKESSSVSNKRRDSDAATSEEGESPAIPIDWAAATSQLGSVNWADVDEDDDLGPIPLPVLDDLPPAPSKHEEDEDDEDVEDPLAHVHDMIADDDDDAEEEEQTLVESSIDRSENVEEQRAQRTAIRPLEHLQASEPERHLSKKEIKRQELQELDTILAEFGIESSNDNGNEEEKVKEDEAARRRREKRKLKKAAGKGGASEINEAEENNNNSNNNKELNGDANEAKDDTQDTVEPKKDGPALDPSKLKALALGKKKSKGPSVLDKASAEAKARAAKQAALKKKEMAKLNKKNNKPNP